MMAGDVIDRSGERIAKRREISRMIRQLCGRRLVPDLQPNPVLPERGRVPSTPAPPSPAPTVAESVWSVAASRSTLGGKR